MILEEMYSGRFYPCETVVPTSEVYRKAVKACENLMEQLSQRLSKEDYELVKELRAQTAIAQCEESESHFKYGFSAGLIVLHDYTCRADVWSVYRHGSIENAGSQLCNLHHPPDSGMAD